MHRLILYIHGKGGNAAEAEHYKSLLTESDVIGFDYQSQTPWKAAEEFPRLFDVYSKGYESVILIANSIGAFFALNALSNKKIEQALFISPVVNMERLITDMMQWSHVTEAELCSKKEIPTDFGETLSWEYLCYVRKHPIVWNIPTRILYGEKDALTAKETISEFAKRIGAPLTVMKDGEHWFHTEAQMAFLDRWIAQSVQK